MPQLNLRGKRLLIAAYPYRFKSRNSFSRSSKTGLVYSKDYETSFRIEYTSKEKLPTGDDFSWSQFRQQPLRLTGRFVRFFDGKVKKFIVFHVERVTKKDEVDDYFNNQRAVLIP